jgi:hypothetical protein
MTSSRRSARAQKTATPSPSPALPKSARDVLQSPGEPLSGRAREQMEARFGRDFSGVRVHTDADAMHAAHSLGANAFTVGEHIVFGPGHRADATGSTTPLLAHELTHVVQQTDRAGRGVTSPAAAEVEAQRSGARVAAGERMSVTAGAESGAMQRDPSAKALDATAEAIVSAASDEKTPAEERAVAAVQSIIREYHASSKALVADVKYDDAKAGSGVHVEQKFDKTSKPENSTGIINVGKTFLAGVTKANFARRVLQVGHEIEHITQWRGGLAGGQHQAEREFLAFYHEALATEKPGTGQMAHAMRVALIDASLRNFFCLDADTQTSHESKRKELVARRGSEVTASKRTDLGAAPTACKQSS